MCDLSNFDDGMIVGARHGGSNISVTAALLKFSHSAVHRERCGKQKHSGSGSFMGRNLVNEKVQQRMSRLLQTNRKATHSQITAVYNINVLKGISERKIMKTHCLV